MGIWSKLPLPAGDGEEKSSLFFPSFSPLSSTLHLLDIHLGGCTATCPHFCGCSVCYCLLPTSPCGISFYLSPSDKSCMLVLPLIQSPPHPSFLPCITLKTLVFILKHVCASLLNFNSWPFYSCHFLLLSSDLFLHIPLQLEQTPSLYVPNSISLFLFRKEAENSSYHPSMLSLWLNNTGDN